VLRAQGEVRARQSWEERGIKVESEVRGWKVLGWGGLYMYGELWRLAGCPWWVGGLTSTEERMYARCVNCRTTV
jgi:hypothetical protein